MHGILHREGDKPACENVDGSKRWFLNGNLHREDDKPADENSNGDKHWYVNGNATKVTTNQQLNMATAKNIGMLTESVIGTITNLQSNMLN